MSFNGYIFGNEKKLRVIPYNDGIIRITCGDGDFHDRDSLVVTAKKPDSAIGESYEDEDNYYVKTKLLTVSVSKMTLSVIYYDNNRCVVSSESPEGRSIEKHNIYKTVGGETESKKTVDGLKTTVNGGGRELDRTVNEAKLKVIFDVNETVFGLGSQEEGYANLRGQYIPLFQENMRIAVPYFVSTKGYAYLFDCTSFMTFNNGEIFMDAVETVDYYFIYADNFDGVCAGYRFLTGVTPMLPKWAVGYCQSKERYATQEELVDVVKEYRRRGVPLDLVVQDWMYWRDGLWGDKVFDNMRYPDPEKLTETLHSLGAKLMISIWPNVAGDCMNRNEMRDAGKMLGDGSVYNAYDEEARALYWKHAYEGLFKYGIDAWWCDSSEPYDPNWGGHDRLPLAERTSRAVNEFKKFIDDTLINAYSLHHSRGIYENQRKAVPEKRVVNLTRSGFAGQHRYGTVVWSGDISAKWETLEKQVKIAQNYIACGEAYWNCDIGAFFVRQRNEWFGQGDYPDGCNDFGYRELYTRWLQFAAFTPLMRSHGTETPREIWRFGEKGEMFYDAIESAIRLRYKLVPYLYSLNAAVTFDGIMPLRALALEYPDDKKTVGASGEFLVGHELLVCPVTAPMYYGVGSQKLENTDKTVDVYLPSGGWFDLYTEKYYEGGKTYKVKATIENIPVFVREGSIIPTVKVMQYTGEDENEPFDVLIFAGENGKFALYNDAGDGYDYENGEYTRTIISYDDTTGNVTETTEGKTDFSRELHYRVIHK